MFSLQDDDFVVDYSVIASQPTFEQTLELLNYTRTRVNSVTLSIL